MSAANNFWRRLAYAGSRYGPTPWVRYSPAFFGAAFAVGLPKHREMIRGNLRRIHGPRGAAREHWDVLRTFVSYAHCLAESLACDREEAQSATTRIVGGAEVDAAIAEGRGAVIVTAHCGAWDAMAGLLRRDKAVDLAVVMAREIDENARSLHDGVRRRTGVEIIHVGNHPLEALPLLKKLRRGGAVAIQLDRAPPFAPTVRVDLFGEAFEVPLGPFLLAASAEAPILPIFCRRLGYFDYEVVVCPAIRVPRRPTEEQLSLAAQAATRSMEHFLRQSPTQWFHFAR